MKTTITFLKATLFLCVIINFPFKLQAETELNTLAGLHCPDNVWIDCNDELWDLSMYGNAYYVDYSGPHDAGAPAVVYNLNSCNAGTIVRTWAKYIYGYLYTCSQTIYVSGGSFNENNIHWPPFEYQVQGCNPPTNPQDLPPPYNGPTHDYVTCSLVAKTHNDQVFTFSSTCKKILRTWTYIDWCQYNPGYPNGPGKWSYTQLIKIEMAEEPIINCPEDIIVWANTCTTGYANIPALTVEGNACGGEYIITNDSPFSEYEGANISGVYPIGDHRVKYKIEYACGEKRFCYVDISVEDSKAAVPLCYGNIAVALMPVFENNNYNVPVDGMVEIWANDLNKGSYHPCRANEDLIYSFSSDPTDQSITFTCDDVGENEVQMWVTDERGNQNFCRAIIDVQNNSANIPNCQPQQPMTDARIAGQLTDMWQQPTEEAMVKITGYSTDISYITHIDTSIVISLDSFQNNSGAWLFYELRDTVISEIIDTVLTDISKEMYSTDSGAYMFDALSPYHHYKIAPEKSTKAADGVKTQDIIKVFYHLIGRERFDHPFYYLAADVDQSGSVDLNDVLIMLDVYQGKRADFPVESNWLFISKTQVWEENVNAFDIEWQHHLDIMSLDEDSMYNDFWSIQLGDVSQNDDSDDGKTKNRAKLSNSEELVNYTREKDYQFFSAYYSGPAELIENFVRNQDVLVKQEENGVKLLWLAETTLNKSISKVITQIPSNSMKMSVVRSNNIVEIDIANQSLRVLESFPNPFKDQVELAIDSHLDQEVQIEVRNALGKLIWKENKSLHVGSNQWIINLGHLSAKGLLLYTVSSNSYEFNGKWIRLQ